MFPLVDSYLTSTQFILETHNRVTVSSCHWNDGVIPFAFNFYSLSPKRLTSLVRNSHQYIEERSCLTFQEHNPLEMAQKINFTYLYYSYSDVLESCCTPFFTKLCGRRLVLLTPLCILPFETAHATLHAIGLCHTKGEPFPKDKARLILFGKSCRHSEYKKALFESTL